MQTSNTSNKPTFYERQELELRLRTPLLSSILEQNFLGQRFILLLFLAPLINFSSAQIHTLISNSSNDGEEENYNPFTLSAHILKMAKEDLLFDDFEFNLNDQLAECQRNIMIEILKIRLDDIINNASKFNLVVEKIFQYFDVLTSKRIQLITENKWGDVDDSKWWSLVFEFCIEKLDGLVNEWGAIVNSPTIQETDVGRFLSSKGPIQLGAPILVKSIIEDGKVLNSLKAFYTIPNVSPSPAVVETGRDFEEALFIQIKEELPNLTVSLTSESGDQGADLIILSPRGKMVIQAKYYQGSVGNTAVQEVFAAKQFYKSDFAMVICDSYYTKSAINLAEKTNVYLKTKSDFIFALKELLS